MNSTYELTPQRVREIVPQDAVGFYRLGIVKNDQFWPLYIGRSDRGLQSRLLQHSRQRPGVTHFQPAVTRTIRRAFELECRGWHLHGDRLENDIHPARPKRIGYECPYCDLKESIEETAEKQGQRA